MNPDTLGFQEYFSNQIYNSIDFDLPDWIDERLPQVIVPTRRDLNVFPDWKLQDSSISQIKVKVFTLYQIFEKLDSFIAEVTKLKDVKIIVGGSLGLLLQGYELDRPIGDLDILIQCSHLNKDVIQRYLESTYYKMRSSESSDFQTAIRYQNIKVDYCFRNKVEYVTTAYNGKSYFVNDYRNIIRYKVLYSQANDKHFYDIIKLIDKQPIKKLKFTTNV